MTRNPGWASQLIIFIIPKLVNNPTTQPSFPWFLLLQKPFKQINNIFSLQLPFVVSFSQMILQARFWHNFNHQPLVKPTGFSRGFSAVLTDPSIWTRKGQRSAWCPATSRPGQICRCSKFAKIYTQDTSKEFREGARKNVWNKHVEKQSRSFF